MQKVFAVRTESYEEDMVTRLYEGIERLGMVQRLSGGKTVLLKMNVAGPFPVEQAATTHPEVVRAMVRVVKSLGSKPVIGDGPNSNQPCFSICGIEKVAREEEVPLCSFSSYKEVASGGEQFGQIRYATDVSEADILVNMAKLKTHALVYYTGAVKNMFGAVYPGQRKTMHLHNDVMRFSNILLDVFQCRIPDLCIMDAITVMEGMGPTHGTPAAGELLACSTDAFALDKLCAGFLGYDIRSIPLFLEAARRGLTTLTPDDIERIGDFDWDKERGFKRVPIYEEQVRKRFLKMALGSPKIDSDKCVICGLCSRVCPAHAIEPRESEIPLVRAGDCINCYCCNELCPVGAVTFEKRRLG